MDAAEREALKADAADAFADAAPSSSNDSRFDGEARADAPASSGSLKDGLETVWGEVRGSISERAELLSLEARRAGLALAELIVMAVLAALLLVSAWVAVLGGIVWAVIAAGVHWAPVLIGAIVITAGSAFLLLLRAKGLAKYMGFEASLRQLRAATRDPRNEPPTAAAMDGVHPSETS
jgi:hypothetical protein